jgi:DNA-binding GntR family transcriptional regulator
MEAVDKTADRTAVRQIADQLRALIEGGVLGAGDVLPSPAAIAHECGVHVHTARSAVTMLAHEGLVQVYPGHGAVVTGEQPVFAHELPPGPCRITARMPTQRERQDLDIPPGVPLLVVERADEGERLTEQHIADRTALHAGAVAS